MEELVFFIALGLGAVDFANRLKKPLRKYGFVLFVCFPWALLFRHLCYEEWPWVVRITLLLCAILIAEPFPKNYLPRIREEVKSLFQTLLIVSVIMYFIVQAFKIPSGSMMDTYLVGDHLFACKFRYGWYLPVIKKYVRLADPKRGDVIIFKYPLNTKKDFIKRCIGLPGETIQIKNKKVYINGAALAENYTKFADGDSVLPAAVSVRDNYGPVKIPENSFFAMGDNRDRSADSRFWGFLERRYLRGKALFVYWPPKRIAGGHHARPEFEN